MRRECAPRQPRLPHLRPLTDRHRRCPPPPAGGGGLTAGTGRAAAQALHRHGCRKKRGSGEVPQDVARGCPCSPPPALAPPPAATTARTCHLPVCLSRHYRKHRPELESDTKTQTSRHGVQDCMQLLPGQCPGCRTSPPCTLLTPPPRPFPPARQQAARAGAGGGRGGGAGGARGGGGAGARGDGDGVCRGGGPHRAAPQGGAAEAGGAGDTTGGCWGVARALAALAGG